MIENKKQIDDAFEEWVNSDPRERTAHSGFIAGWEAAMKSQKKAWFFTRKEKFKSREKK